MGLKARWVFDYFVSGTLCMYFHAWMESGTGVLFFVGIIFVVRLLRFGRSKNSTTERLAIYFVFHGAPNGRWKNMLMLCQHSAQLIGYAISCQYSGLTINPPMHDNMKMYKYS